MILVIKFGLKMESKLQEWFEIYSPIWSCVKKITPSKSPIKFVIIARSQKGSSMYSYMVINVLIK